LVLEECDLQSPTELKMPRGLDAIPILSPIFDSLPSSRVSFDLQAMRAGRRRASAKSVRDDSENVLFRHSLITVVGNRDHGRISQSGKAGSSTISPGQGDDLAQTDGLEREPKVDIRRRHFAAHNEGTSL